MNIEFCFILEELTELISEYSVTAVKAESSPDVSKVSLKSEGH